MAKGKRVAFVLPVLVLGALLVTFSTNHATEPYRFTAAMYQPAAARLTGGAVSVDDPTDGQVARFAALAVDPTAFVHPGVLVTADQLAFVRDRIAAGAQPWAAEFAKLQTAAPRFGTRAGVPYVSSAYTATPVASVYCDQSDSALASKPCNDETNDATAAYADALMFSYQPAGLRETYAQKAVAIINGWSAVFRTRVWTAGNVSQQAQASLQASWAAPLFVRAAEILRYTYTPAPGAAALDLTTFRTMLDTVYGPFVAAPPQNGAANWQLSYDEAAMSIAVYEDDHPGFATAVARWERDVPSTIYLASDVNPYPALAGLPLVAPGSSYDTPTVTASSMITHWRSPARFPDGLEQETCRDMPHMAMAIGSLTAAAETARIQGVDLYATQAARLAAGMETESGYLTGGAAPAGWPCPTAPVEPSTREWTTTFSLARNELANRLGLSTPNLDALVDTIALPSTIRVNHNQAFEALTSTEAPRGTGCPAPDARLGTVTSTLTVPSGGTYRLWLRTQPSASGSNLLYAAVDGGCPQVVGGPRTQAAGSWTWVDAGADSATPVTLPLAPGQHTLVLSGLSPDLEVSRVLLTLDTGCAPSGLTDTCADAIPPTAPTVTASATSAAGVDLSWSGATAQSAIDHYVVFRDGSQATITSASTWSDTEVGGGETHVYTVVAVDAYGLSSAPSDPATATTPLPPRAVTLTVPAASVGTLDLSAGIDPPDGVTRVDYLVDGTVVATSDTTPFDATWDSTSVGNGTHTLQAVAYGDQGDISPSGPASITLTNPDTHPPTVPAGLTVTATSQTAATVSWRAATDDVGVSGYDVYRDGTLVGTTPTTTYPDTGLAVGATYTWTVVARDAAGNASDASAPASFTVPDLTAPDIPTGVTATATSGTSVSVSWTAATDNVGVTGYTVLRNGTAVATTAATTFTDTTVAVGTGYSYTIRADDAAGNTSAASTAAVVVTPAPPDTTAPTAPKTLGVATRSTSTLTLTWGAATDNVGVASYAVFRNGARVASGLTSTSYTDSGLAEATSYAYRVVAYDAAGNASPAATLTASTLDGTPPTAPGTPAVYATSATATALSWAPATDNVAVTGYVVSRNGLRVGTATSTGYADTGLTAGATYRYTVAAVDAAGNTGPSVAVATSTPAATVAAGSGLTGSYFAGTSLSGPAVTRRDSTLKFTWGTGAPVAGVPADNFSARWTGTLTPATTGTYKLYLDADDGVRLWVDGTLLVDRWTDGAKSASTTVALKAGTGAALRVEYYESTGSASAALSWSGPGVATKTTVPSSVLTSRTRGLAAAYFPTGDLTGPPAVVRTDPNVQFSWGTGSPDARVPADTFSARWTGRLKAPSSATYTVTEDSDSGIRVWVNGRLLIDRWAAHTLATASATIALTGGTTYDLRVEYRETTGNATVNLYWAYGGTAKTIIPTSALTDS